MPGDRIPHSELLPTEGGLHHTMSMIKHCTVVLSNGNVVGMHANESDAHEQARELAYEWRRQSDCGSEVPAPRLAVLSFNDWMELQEEFAF